MSNKYLKFIVFIILVIAFDNLFDLLFCIIFTRSEYGFDIFENMFIPLLVGGIIGCTMMFRDSKKSED